MRIERLRLSGFGEERVSTLADLRGGSDTRRFRLSDGFDASVVSEAICWALQGRGPEPGASTEVELELRVGEELFRIRRAVGKRGRAKAKAEVVAWRSMGLDDDAEEGQEVARGDEAVGALLSSSGIAPPATLQLALDARASELAAASADPEALASWLEGASDGEAAGDLERRLEDLLLAVEGEADLVRLRRAEALAKASERLGDEASASLTLEELDERREEARLRLEAARSAVTHLDAAASHARALSAPARARQRRLDELARARDRLRAAESKQAEIACLKRELERAEAAAGLVRKEKKLSDRKSLKAQEAASRVLRKAEDERRRILERGEISAERLRNAQGEAAAAASMRERLVELEDLEGVLALLDRTQASLARSEEEREEQQARRAAADASLQDLNAEAGAAERALERARAALGDEGTRRLEELRESLAESEARLGSVLRLVEVQEQRKQVTKLHATTMIHLDRARRAHDAELRLLRRRLSGDGPPPDEEEIEEQRATTAGLEADLNRLGAEQEEQETEVQALGAEVLQLRQVLGSLAYSEPAEIQAATVALREELEEAGAPAETLARAEAESTRLSSERERLEGELRESEAELTAFRAKEESERDLAAELVTRVPEGLRTREALEQERRKVETALAAGESELALAEAAAAQQREELAAIEDACAEARDRHLEASAVVERAHEELAQVVKEAGFQDIAAYQDAKRDNAQRKKASGRLSELDTELQEAREAHRALEGLTNVPVLREADRADLEQEEWERRQSERKERLQSERVHRDKELLEGLLEQLQSEHATAVEEEARLAAGWEAIERASQETSGFAETLRTLRSRHQGLSQLTDLAAGRVGPSGGFAAFLRESVAGEAAARAGQWCRRLSGGELHLAVEREEGGWSLELREVHGRGRRSAAEMSPEERWLGGLCLALGRGEAACLQAGVEPPLSLVIDRLPPAGDEAARERVARWLERLEESGRRSLSGVDAAGASESLPLLARRGRVAAGKAV